MKKAAELIFIPIPGIGHIVSTVEIAKLLLARDCNLSVTVLVMKFPFSSDGTDAYIASLSDPNHSEAQRIKFINLPQQQFDANGGALAFFKFPGKHQSHVRDVVTKLLAESETTRIAGFVLDMFCTDMIDVADELGLPSYIFFTSSAASLGLQLHLQALHDEENKDCTEFKNSDAELAVPSFVNPLPAARVLPFVFLDKESSSFAIEFSRKIKSTKGILVNTFSDLESHALHSLNSGRKFPPVYSVGPILNVSSEDNRVSSERLKQKSDILGWLDDQPPSSVVFLCFGSMGSFGEDQVKEIAHGIENSGFRFVWSLRQPPKGKFGFPSDYADQGSVLPEGFLNRTTEIGKVIGWAPQVAILAHPAIGGFVSHCGWNSSLESIWFGVPIAAWPFFAEQQLNAFELVKELGLAVEIDVSYRRDSGVIVNRQTIEKGISDVMEQDSKIRNKVKEMSKMSREALQPDGSSHSSLGRFINQIQSSLF